MPLEVVTTRSEGLPAFLMSDETQTSSPRPTSNNNRALRTATKSLGLGAYVCSFSYPLSKEVTRTYGPPICSTKSFKTGMVTTICRGSCVAATSMWRAGKGEAPKLRATSERSSQARGMGGHRNIGLFGCQRTIDLLGADVTEALFA